MFYGITDLSTYILGTIFIVLLPGPNSLYVMTIASRHGVAMGYRGACGIFAGDTILMLASASGAASLLQTTPALFMLIKYVGAGYLAWIGIGLLRSAINMWRDPDSATAAATAAAASVATSAVTTSPSETPIATIADASRPFRTALVISLMNPKAILFFVSFFIQFVDPAYPHPALSFLILGVIVQVFSAIYLSVLIFGGAHLAEQFRRRRRISASATGAVGALFVGFALKLANASLA